MHYTYILYSETLERYYSGTTSGALKDRLRRHNTNHSGFTGRANDWQVVFHRSFNTISEAISLEKKIKERGAKRFLEDIPD